MVITLRADFYHHCAEYEGLRLALEKHQTYIGDMTPDELREAIVQPAERNGWDFQPGLVDLILGDVGTEPGALPLLSHALLETWKRRQGRTLTLEGYADAGGVKKAIAQTAESIYDRLSPEEQTIARGIFLRLTELGEGVQDTRRRARFDELAQTKEQEAVAKVLKTLTDARLATTEQDGAEVAHEALIREWGTLRKWLDEDRESLRLHRHLTESAQEWQRSGREASELYRGERLRQIQKWMKEHSDSLSPLESEFLKASQDAKSQERLRWITLGGVGVMLLLATVLAQMGYFNCFMYRPVDMEGYWETISGGEFQMGSGAMHNVYLDEYQIGKHEVTNKQYNQCLRASICIGSVVPVKLDHAVINVNWYAAKTYGEWVGGRLPTEAEWEKAASWDAETKTKFVYPWGNSGPTPTLLNYNAAFVGNTTPVGTYSDGVSPYGLYDMAGNVWEWVNDWYDENYYPNSPSSNPLGPDLGQYRVVRCSSWNDNDRGVRSGYRTMESPTNYFHNLGFRCARSPEF